MPEERLYEENVQIVLAMTVIIVMTSIAGATASASDYDAEAEAKAGTTETPFTDVPNWAAQYVGYLYANNLTKGVGATAYGAGNLCDAQMFTVFVLRSLGYTEAGGDFTYAQAQDYAASIGLIGDTGMSGDFTRDDMVALSYSAVFQPVKGGGGDTLLDKLVEEKAVDAAVADKYIASYETYQGLLDDIAKYNSVTGIHLTTDAELQEYMQGEQITTSQKMDITAVQDGNNYMMKMTSSIEVFGDTDHTSIYIADGYIYLDTGTEKVKYMYLPGPGAMSSATQQAGLRSDGEPFYLIKSVSKTEDGAARTYKIVYSGEAINSLLGSTLPLPGLSQGETVMQINSLEEVYTFDGNGNLKSVQLTGDIIMTATNGQETLTVDAKFWSTTKIIATGSSVTVAPPPNLSSYIEFEEFPEE